jgi:RNA polymerase sigma-70 factor (ECF subfamily)
MDEIELIKRCQQGSKDDFNTLLQIHLSKAVRYAYLITGQKDISEDIVQEAFIECYRDIRNLKNPDKFKAWFYRILVRNSWRYKEREKAKVSTCQLNENLDNQVDSCSKDSLNNILEFRETSKMLRDALDKLSMPLRTTVVLHYYNGLSIKEIAQILNCFQGTVKSRLHNARKLLGKELIKNGFEYEGRECKINA